MKTISRHWIIIGLVLPLWGCQKAAEPESEAEPPPAAVSVVQAKMGDIPETVTAQGTLIPIEGGAARVTSPLPGRIERILVREGDTVRAGQTLAVLDGRTQSAQTQSASAALQAANSLVTQSQLSAAAAAADQKNALQAAQLLVAAAIADRAAALQNAQTALDLARTDLAKTFAGARPGEIVQARDAVSQAEATRKRADSEAKRQQFLFDKGISARRLLEDATTALALAEAGLESAQQSLGIVQAGARTEERNAARLRVRQTEEALRQAKVAGDARIAQARAALKQATQAALLIAAKNQEVRVARDNSAKAVADLSAARVQSDFGIIRAPIGGIVTKRGANPGDLADAATPIFEITDLRQLDLSANLPADETRIRPGMRARVTFGGGTAYEARVVRVGQVDAQSNLLSLRVRVPNRRRGLRLGAFGTAEIVLRTGHAVVLPKAALLTRDGKSVVFVADGETAKQTEVEAGAERNGLVAIEKGLKSGQSVVRLGQYELEDGQKIKVTP